MTGDEGCLLKKPAPTVELGLGQDAPADRKAVLPVADVKGRNGGVVGDLERNERRFISLQALRQKNTGGRLERSVKTEPSSQTRSEDGDEKRNPQRGGMQNRGMVKV